MTIALVLRLESIIRFRPVHDARTGGLNPVLLRECSSHLSKFKINSRRQC